MNQDNYSARECNKHIC